MSTLLVWREKLQRIYALYSIYIQKGLQFVTGLVLFWVINSNIGFMKPASSVFCTLGLAVICTFLPMTITVLAATALILAHFYALSLPIALVALVIFILMYIFYFRFTPKKAWLVLISGLAFSLKIPFVIPIAFGLLGSPVWIVPASCGIITYYMTDYVKVSAAALKEADASGIAANLMSFTKQVLASKEMWLMVMAVTIGILVVNFVRTRGVDHSWKIASAAGAAVTVVVSAAGNIVLSTNISYIEIILSAVLGAVTGLVLELTHNGQKWWDYTGFFLNLHGRICVEGLLAFGIGGMAIVYFVAPLLDNYFRKIKLQIIIPLCVALMMIFVADQLYTKKHPNVGEGITCLNIYDMYYYL